MSYLPTQCVLCAGVCSYDLIFSNGLFMYMSDTEVHSLFTKALSWLRPGGFMFFHETCFTAHGTVFTELIMGYNVCFIVSFERSVFTA